MHLLFLQMQILSSSIFYICRRCLSRVNSAFAENIKGT
ncbi:hypothetical protein BACCAP_04444 [Pseudoflavonifractor capillosus ATCC 29799]|uniref:Uncharacterized protein n=1 Tax=Pseudoflavonifractor capillosus ATCC 29799 TaxID=411467 RepID=A6P1S3_9FIRM|nr:hypothetical protein BACCAP_04444 [Pseudoflavonifractor capillosus ATCC 29799]